MQSWARAIPGLGRIITAGVIAYFFCHASVPSAAQLSAIQSALTSASGTLLGFVITSAAILLALPDRPLVVNMRKTGHLHNLLVQLVSTGAVLLALLVCSIGANFAGTGSASYLATASVFLGMWAVLLVVSIGRKFYLVATFVARG